MVLTCDVCGEPIEGEPVIVEIEGAVLTLCQKCARKYAGTRGVRVIRGPTQIQPNPQGVAAVRYESKRGTVFRVRRTSVNVDRYEVVDNYAELIREAREALGMSRDILAKVVGIKESVLRRIEDGQLTPDIELARKLEKVLGISLIRESEDTGIEVKTTGTRGLTVGDVITIRESRSKKKE
ncbi:multiprotein bridging factor aMBF1 [Vulcanisaeta thermophila]|uniref:multiprotein bridging factor aMBF1 n=1 Tax=Vulcanisaeta thermophila TaxID=867917 RepID=UPI0008531812|nr:multiprotein bridging factor aMBF1 [Vulcanisaeta thermophila]